MRRANLSRVTLAVWFTLVASLSAGQTTGLTPDQIRAAIENIQLSMAVYNLTKNSPQQVLHGGWREVDRRIDDDGFKAAVYERTLENGRIDRRVVFAGTDSPGDWRTNVSQGLRLPGLDIQFRKAEEFARSHVEEKDHDERVSMSFVGHSLGGALAQFCSLVLDVKATVFNSSALNQAIPNTRPSMRANADSLILNIHSEDDPVHDPTAMFLGARQFGRDFQVALLPELKATGLDRFLSLKTHGLEALTQGLERAYQQITRPSRPGAPDPGWTRPAVVERAEVTQDFAERVASHLLVAARLGKEIAALDRSEAPMVAAWLDRFPTIRRQFETSSRAVSLEKIAVWADKAERLGNAFLADLRDLQHRPDSTIPVTAWVESKTLDALVDLGVEAVLGEQGTLGRAEFARGMVEQARKGLTQKAVTEFCNGYVNAFASTVALRATNNRAFAAAVGDAAVVVADDIRLALRVAEPPVSQFMASSLGATPHAVLETFKVLQMARVSRGLAPFASLEEAYSTPSKDGVVDTRQGAEMLRTMGVGQDTRAEANRYTTDLMRRASEIKTVSVPASSRTMADSLRDVKVAAGLVGSRERTVVVGVGPVAELVAAELVKRNGAGNVVRVPVPPSWGEAKRAAIEHGVRSVVAVGQEEFAVRAGGSFARAPFTAPTPSASPLPGATRPDRPSSAPITSSTASRPSTSRTQLAQSFGSSMMYGASPGVGGVALRGTAALDRGTSQRAIGDFSLIFQGLDGAVDVPSLRRFMTALWATYLSGEGPGISIDPIGKFTDRHLVRYIGNVVNSDLGRVMREADYLMKSWAVGTSRPALDGWMTPDQIGARNKLIHVGAPSRFWFVPEEMTFRQAGDAVLFESGRMAVKTEYLSTGTAGTNLENEEWARQFTMRYDEVAAQYPIFSELMEYAKAVSLTKYLKEQGLPMLWFLLANREMVITEDSPGTVEAFAKKSDYVEELQISGGVDLSRSARSGSFVMDAQLLQALREATEGREASAPEIAPPAIRVLGADGTALSVSPAEEIVMARPAEAGAGYATDLALRVGGEAGVELSRYARPDLPPAHTFGRNWHLLIPYGLRVDEGTERVPFLNAMVPAKVVLRNFLNGQEEVLRFDANRYRIAGYVPDYPASSLNIGVFLLSDGSFRLADKLGSEFQFDQSGRLTDMVLSPRYRISYGYGQRRIGWTEFERLPARLESGDAETVLLGALRVPARMRLVESASGEEEVLALDRTQSENTVRYVPSAGGGRYRRLQAMSDGSFLALRGDGTEVAFDAGGRFRSMTFSTVERMAQGRHEIAFEYAVANSEYHITTARVSESGNQKLAFTVFYRYDGNGRLVGSSVEKEPTPKTVAGAGRSPGQSKQNR